MISEEKCFANFELFPRVSTAKRTRNGQPPQPKIIRTIDTEIFGFEERRLKTMIEVGFPLLLKHSYSVLSWAR